MTTDIYKNLRIFAAENVYILMKRFDNHPLNAGGGGYRSLTQEVITVRLHAYINRKWHTHPSGLKPLWRSACAYVLAEGFEYSQKKIADILSTTQPLVSNDLKNARFYVGQFTNFRTLVSDIYDYILYNARYLH